MRNKQWTNFDIPIFKKILRPVRKRSMATAQASQAGPLRHLAAIEDTHLDIIEGILFASQTRTAEKAPVLERRQREAQPFQNLRAAHERNEERSMAKNMSRSKRPSTRSAGCSAAGSNLRKNGKENARHIGGHSSDGQRDDFRADATPMLSLRLSSQSLLTFSPSNRSCRR